MIKDFIQKVFKTGNGDSSQYEHIDKAIYREYNKFRLHGPKPYFCYVPFNSLTFSFRGKVYSCTYNRQILLGTYPENSLMEIWQGPEAVKLREHMLHNDLNYGCQHCKYFFDKRKFSNLKPLVFDKYSDIKDQHFPRVLEFEMSNTCNYECQMCSGEVSSMIRKNRDKLPPIEMPYNDRFVEELDQFIPHVKEAKFFGGEPFLIDIYFRIWDRMLELNPGIQFFVITNGSVWNNRIARMLERGHFEIAISIDSLQKEKLERIRKHSRYEKVMANIKRFNKYAKQYDRAISLSFTLQKDNWEDFPEMISFCNDIGAYIYVSYLEWPVHYAISDLEEEELLKIREFMSGYSFVVSDNVSKHNAQCFEDFKTYLDGFISQYNSGRYMEYRHSEVSKKKKEALDSISEIPVEELKFHFEEKMKVYFETHSELLERHEDMHKVTFLKFRELMSKLDPPAQTTVLRLMMRYDIGTVLRDVYEKPLEFLLEIGKSKAAINEKETS